MLGASLSNSLPSDRSGTNVALEDVCSTLYHATRLLSFDSILGEGVLQGHCGLIHGKMDVRPPVPTVYLSSNPRSNNLNTRLFDTGPEQVIILEISTRLAEIQPSNIYPDDWLFTAFADGRILDDEHEIAGKLNIPLGDACALLESWNTAQDHNLAKAMQSAWPWYLGEHGEISVSQNIAPSAIVAARMYGTGELIFSQDSDARQDAGANRKRKALQANKSTSYLEP